MKLIVGLGNPGDKYNNNRANIGFKILDVIANNINVEIKTKKKKSMIGRGDFEGDEVVLLKPQTFSDLSGESVLYIASFLKIKVQDIVVIHEDTELSLGQIVVEKGGDERSHLGISSISASLRSKISFESELELRTTHSKVRTRKNFSKKIFPPQKTYV